MRKLIILVVGFMSVLMFLGCKAGKHLVSTENRTHIIVKDKLVPVFRPADSASIRALMECDSNGRVLLSWLDLANSRNTELQFKLDSMGNLRADFKVPSDTVYLPGKDSIRTETVVQVKEVPRDFTKWQTFCLWIVPIAIGIFIVYLGFKSRSIICSIIRFFS